ncbi:MAG: glycosyltransferase family 39 protein, partial [Salinibacterium sp.]|nr:glycosyltransferase family 39 protein [Salinibacterium sp.]
KGPGVAWIIRLATELLGTSEAAVRTPAAVASAITALGVAGMARSIANDGRAAFVAAAMVLLIPVYQAVAMIMTIDGPFLACWAVAGWAALAAMRRRGRWSWLVLGIALALGFVFKYTMVLLVPGLAVFLVLCARSRSLAPRWGVWAIGGAAIACLGLLPVLVWNAHHDWATVHHLLGHAGMPGGDQKTAPDGRTLEPLGALEFVGVQLGAVGPLLAAMLLGVFARDPRENWKADRLLCVWAALPVLIGYGALSFFTRIEGNWPIAGYITLVPLAATGVVRAKDDVRERAESWLALPKGQRPRAGLLRKRPESVMQMLWDWSIGWGLIAGFVMLRLDLVTRLPWPGEGKPMDRIVARLMEADVRADHAQRLLDSLRDQTGSQPFVLAQQYGRASQLAFYLPGRPTVFAASSFTGGRRTQYDEWAHTDLRSPEVVTPLLGRPALVVGGVSGQWDSVFDRVEEVGTLEGERKSGRDAYLGYGFRGFAAGGPVEPE